MTGMTLHVKMQLCLHPENYNYKSEGSKTVATSLLYVFHFILVPAGFVSNIFDFLQKHILGICSVQCGMLVIIRIVSYNS